jgi:hypothetical protein
MARLDASFSLHPFLDAHCAYAVVHATVSRIGQEVVLGWGIAGDLGCLLHVCVVNGTSCAVDESGAVVARGCVTMGNARRNIGSLPFGL